MKKLTRFTRFIIILYLLTVLTGCVSLDTIDSEKGEVGQRNTMQDDININENEVKVGDSIYNIKEKFKGSILLEQYSCVVLEASEGYYIACTDQYGQTIRAVVKFSKDLELVEADGIEPIEEIDPEEWTGKSEHEFVSQYGSCHFDFGSGLYIPSYISESGLIYFLYVDDGMIYYISTFSPEQEQKNITLK